MRKDIIVELIVFIVSAIILALSLLVSWEFILILVIAYVTLFVIEFEETR